jgi:hypothetical protein
MEPGDLVEFRRDLFHHWSVYIGVWEGSHRVIHLTGFDDFDPGASLSASFEASAAHLPHNSSFTNLRRSFSSGNLSNMFRASVKDPQSAEVRCDDILDVSRDCRCRVNNGQDSNFPPLPSEVVVERAMGALGTKKYHILLTNCEHFATWCRYGSKSSTQASRAKSALVALGTAALYGSAGVGFVAGTACYLLCRFGNRARNEISNRFDVGF